ncbi:tetratricopeptide repeat protein [Pseudoalteromonas gelatinilytica]
MTLALQKIAELIKQKKIKKALQLLAKQKIHDYTFFHQKAICHFQLKQYPQALFASKEALKRQPDNKIKVKLLNDMAMISLLISDSNSALEHYKKSLNIDSSANNAFACEQYVMLLLEKGEFSSVIEYGNKLVSLPQHSAKAYIAILSSCLAQKKYALLNSYLSKITTSLNEFSSEQLVNILNMLLANNLINEFNLMLEKLNENYEGAFWLREFNELILKKDVVKPKKSKSGLVTGNDHKLVSLISQLVEHSIAKGASFDPLLEIIASDGELSINYYGDTQTKLIDIPISCMPLLCDYEISLDYNYKLLCRKKTPMLNPEAEFTMELLIDIYNQSNKIEAWLKANPFLALYDSPILLSKLLEAKKYNAKIQKLKSIFESGDKTKLILESFLGSRQLGYKNDFLSKNNIITSNKVEGGLLSVIDFLNHKSNSNSYKNSANSIFVYGNADKTTNEVFVQYNEFDSVLTYLFYGFVDISAPFITSINVELVTTYGQKWTLLGNSVASSELKEGSFAHNHSHLPEISHLTNGTILLNKLLIPTEPKSTLLKDILVNIINTIAPEDILKNDAFFRNEIVNIEKQILVANITYWSDLKKLAEQDTLSSEDAKAQLFLLIEGNLTSLKNYANHNSILLF